MTEIDSTAIPEYLTEEYVDAVIQDDETYVSKLSEPRLVFMTPSYADSTVIPSYTISGRTITFHLRTVDETAHTTATGYGVLIKGRL